MEKRKLSKAISLGRVKSVEVCNEELFEQIVVSYFYNKPISEENKMNILFQNSNFTDTSMELQSYITNVLFDDKEDRTEMMCDINILNENVISMLEEDGAICNKLEEVDEKLENIDECLEDAIKDAIQEGLEMGSDKVLESIDNAIEDFNQKNDGMINSYDNLLEKINDVVARLTEDECKIIHEIRLAYKILERKNNTNN